MTKLKCNGQEIEIPEKLEKGYDEQDLIIPPKTEEDLEKTQELELSLDDTMEIQIENEQ